MILIGLGGNLVSPVHGPPRRTLEAALACLEAAGVRTARRSRWYQSAPVPPSGQPWFVNAVAALETTLPPEALLSLLLDVEARLGRERGVRWAARTADLDLLAYHRAVLAGDRLTLPHPRLHERAFVLVPMAEVAPGWRHPLLGLQVEDLVARLPADQRIEPL